MPTYDVFSETRYFESGDKQKVWEYKQKKIGVLICEDVWMHSKISSIPFYQRDPVEELKQLHPEIVFILSASPYYMQKKDIRLNVYKQVAITLNCPVVCCNQVGANDQLIFDGNSVYLDSMGNIKVIGKAFEEDVILVDENNLEESCYLNDDEVEELFQALVLGIKDYFEKQNLQKACLGLSGGIDSAVSAYIAKEALGEENILAISMPTRFSSLSSFDDANKLIKNLKIKLLDVPIDQIYQSFLDLLSPIFQGRPFDTTEENLQARIRGMVLMAISNKLGYVVLSTGNKSEMAVGYCTLYGDMCGGFGVLEDVSKKMVYQLAKWINRNEEIIPNSIIEKPPSAELKEDQKDTDSLPPYPIVDEILQSYVEDHLTEKEIIEKFKLPKDLVKDLIGKIHLAEYKRRQAPPGVRVTKRSFGKGRFFPIVQGWVK